MTRLERLRRLRREEITWRARVAARIQRDRIAGLLRRPRWDRRTLTHVLAPDVLDPFLRAHIATGNWVAAGATLSRRLAERPSRFVLDPARACELRESILHEWPDAASEAAARADRILAGRFNLLGYADLTFARNGRPIDWSYDPVHQRHPASRFWADVPYLDPGCGDHKIIWELNRHQHWLPLGRALWLTRDRQYGWAMIEQLSDWLEANPPLTGVNWASMLELGFRSISWTWALHFLLADVEAGTSAFTRRPWIVDLLIGIDRQLTHVEQNLSHYFSPNTHLTGEALALYVAGQSIPELAASARWAATGREILLREIDTQIGRDGGHAERSLHYHRYTLDFYLFALLIAERSGDAAAAVSFREAVSRLATFARGMADDSGRLAMIGDDDGGMLAPIAGRNPADVRDSLALAAIVLERPELAPWGVPEEACWLRGEMPPERRAITRPQSISAPASTVFADTGYAVARDGHGGHLVFDIGPHGFLNGGHAHADALAVVLTVAGVPLLIDPGTATYTMDSAARDRFRGSASHNTLTLDGRSSSEPAGPFHWRTRTDARLAAWRSNARMTWAEGMHEGFGAAGHRRSVVQAAGGGWLVLDEVTGRGRHAAEIHWHFDPRWEVTCETKACLRATDGEGRTAWLLHDEGGLALARGDGDAIFGWCSPAYGAIVPAWTARFLHTVLPPASMFTWIAGTLDIASPPVMERLRVDHDPAGPAHGVRVTHGSVTEITVVRPGDGARRESRACSITEYHTDARLLQFTRRGTDLVSLSLADGARALSLIDGLISVAADHPVDDLHLQVRGDRLELVASTIPSRLQLQGTPVSRIRSMWLNGRDVPVTRAGRVDTIVIAAAEWAAPAPETRTICVA